MYILECWRTPDRVEQRAWRDVVDCRFARFERVHGPGAAVVRERDDTESRVLGQEPPDERAGVTACDPNYSDAGAGAPDGCGDLFGVGDLGENLDIALAGQRFTHDIAEKRRHRREDKADAGHADSQLIRGESCGWGRAHASAEWWRGQA